MKTQDFYANKIKAIGSACESRGIPFEIGKSWDGAIITFPWSNGDVVCNGLSGGHSGADLVESFQFPWDKGDVTVLTVKEAIEKITALFLIFHLQTLDITE